MREEIEVIVNKHYWGDAVGVWLIKRDGGKYYNANIDKDGVITFKEQKEGLEQKPLLSTSGRYWQEIVNAIANATPPITEKEVDAELKATKYHLEDMRKLMKLNK